jgi:protein-S-isoprenylcysteine O-methyltransferase Ste14
MDPLRLALFLGLMVHKLVWEVLKKSARLQKFQRPSLGIPGKWLIKSVKALALAFFAIQTLFLDLFPIVEQPSALRFWGTTMFFIGLCTALVARVQLGNNWVDIEDYQVLPEQSLTTTGIYRYIRHPIYSADVLLLIGLELALNSWLVVTVVIPLLIAVKQALAEEALLAQVFPSYQAYCRRTKRFIPFIT